jgi:hypothetical protein
MSQFFTSLEKAVGEVYLLSADFTDLLAAGDYLIGCVVTVTVYSGYDLSPSSMLLGNPIVGAATIGQVIQQGVPGTIYDWVFLAAPVGGKELELKTKIAIAPSGGGGGGSYGITLLESCLYPYEFMDEFIPTVSAQGGRLFGDIYYTEEFTVSQLPAGGTLDYQQFYYLYPSDGMQVVVVARGGVLTYQTFISYDYNEEMQVSVAAGGGTLDSQTIVSYSVPAEEFQVAVVANGGTLQT